MADVEDDPFFGSHMRHMRQMNNMMNSLFADPFGMFGGENHMAIMGPRHNTALMPFMPQMPSMNRLFRDMDGGNMSAGSSFSSSTVVMSSGPNGKPQVYSSTSSTKVGPNGIKETRKTLQDSRTGTKKMAIGHHIGERGHVIEREQNVYTGDAEERQEFINLEEEEAADFDREFQNKAGMATGRPRAAIAPAPAPAPARQHERLALPAPPPHRAAPAPRRALRTARAGASPLACPHSGVREVYGGSHPQRHRARSYRPHRHVTYH